MFAFCLPFIIIRYVCPLLQEQYEYLHLAVLHALTFDCKSIPAEEFITYYSKIVKSKDGSSEIEQQFKVCIDQF